MEILQGKNKILLFRKLSESTSAAAKLAFQTEHTFSYSRDLESIITKDGRVVRVGELESEVSITALASKADPINEMLRDAVINGDKLELWEVTVDPELEETGTFPAVYAQGYLDSWEDAAGAEDDAEISANFIVELEPQFGMATLTEEQQSAVQYAFTDTTAGV